MHVLKLAGHLKAEQWAAAYPLFGKIERLTEQHKLKADDSITFYHGEVAFHLKKYSEAQDYLGRYVSKVGKRGAQYQKSLAMLGQIDGLKKKQLDQDYAQAMYEAGVWKRNGRKVAKKSWKRAEPWLRKAALAGHAKAQNWLGMLYRDGSSSGEIEKDYTEALKWFRMSAGRDDTEGLHYLGEMYKSGKGLAKNANEALRLWKKGAELGGSRSPIWIAHMYLIGDGIEKDREQAIYWYRKVALETSKFSAGDALTAAARLGRIYKDENDDAEAVRWYRRAAAEACIRQGKKCAHSPDSRIKLAEMYVAGRGVEKNVAAAVELYKTVAWTNSKVALGRIYELGEGGIQQDLIKAKKLYLQAAEKNHARAQLYLAKLYEEGRGVRQGYSEAAKWYEKAASGRVEPVRSEALYRLGLLYEEGKGVEQSYTEALKRYSQTWRRREPLLRVAQIYEQGRPGVPLDLSWAYRFYARAADSWLGAVPNEPKTPEEKTVLTVLKGKERVTEDLIARYLEALRSSEPVKRTASGLRFQVLKTAQGGPRPTASDTVDMEYEILFLDGQQVSPERAQRRETEVVNNYWKGMAEAMKMMEVGQRLRLFMPSELANGSKSAMMPNGHQVPPYSLMVAEIELFRIGKK